MSDGKVAGKSEGQNVDNGSAPRPDSVSAPAASPAEDPSRELDEAVLEAQQFILRFKELALKLSLPLTHVSFEALYRAEAVLQRFDYGRTAAEDLKRAGSSEQERGKALDAVVHATREIRRASLLLQAQVFRLDGMLGKKQSGR